MRFPGGGTAGTMAPLQRRRSNTAQRLSQSKPQPVAEAAYYRAPNRGFEPGGETQDWLAAEAEILARVRV